MKKSDFYYDLPQELIAQDPLKDRSSSRLMVLDKKTGEINHGHFTDIVNYLEKGDCLVINNTKVIPARLIGSRVKLDEAGKPILPTSVNDGQEQSETSRTTPVEILLLKRLDAYRWECIVRPGKKLRTGAMVNFGDGGLRGVIEEVLEDGNRIVRFEYEGIFEEILDKLGTMPLPPYIIHKLEDPTRYNTVYAKFEGSAAAPTAGLHFTPELLEKVRGMGVEIAEVTLHVGLGTFRPVKEDDILDHKMHSEYFVVPRDAADKINRAKAEKHRIICVGTTSCRTVEAAATGIYVQKDISEGCGFLYDIAGQTCGTDVNKSPSDERGGADDAAVQEGTVKNIREEEKSGMVCPERSVGTNGYISPCSGETEIFIYPGYEFKICDCLITNFHLPESTLIMLVSALAGRENVLAAYEEAVKERYRFFSFGDAMLIYSHM